MNLNKAIGFQMRIQRNLRELPLDTVAERMGYQSKNTVSYYELGHGDITVDFLLRFCDAVGCDYRKVLEDASAMAK